MTFITREPGLEIQFLQHDPASVTSLPLPAGRLLRLVGNGLVDVITTAASQTAVGWSMSKIKAAYTDLPAYARFASDMGSTDVFKGDPIGVACKGVYEMDQYVDEGTNGIAAGTLLYADNDGKLSDTNADSAAAPAAIALKTLTAAQCTAGVKLLIKALI
jgi:hypothetical protein